MQAKCLMALLGACQGQGTHGSQSSSKACKAAAPCLTAAEQLDANGLCTLEIQDRNDEHLPGCTRQALDPPRHP